MQDLFFFSHVLNPYDVLLLMTTGLSLLMAIPVLIKRDRKLSDVLLALFLLAQGYKSLHNVLVYSKTIGPITNQLLFPFEFAPTLLISGTEGMLLFVFATALINPAKTQSNKWHGVTICVVISMIIINAFNNTGSMDKTFLYILTFWIPPLFSVIYGWWTIIRLHSYDASLPMFHSNVDNHSLTWLKWVSLGFVVVWTLHIAALCFGVFGYINIAIGLSTLNNLPPLILLASMVVYSQTHSSILPAFNASNSNATAQPLKKTRIKPELTQKLENLMTHVKVYQDPELGLEDLADSMGISARSLSTLINTYYKKNFYDFVNQYRVQDAKQQLSDKGNKNKSIQRVFEDAGFNSKTTFNTLFKKYTEQTPSKFRQSI